MARAGGGGGTTVPTTVARVLAGGGGGDDDEATFTGSTSADEGSAAIVLRVAVGRLEVESNNEAECTRLPVRFMTLRYTSTSCFVTCVSDGTSSSARADGVGITCGCGGSGCGGCCACRCWAAARYGISAKVCLEEEEDSGVVAADEADDDVACAVTGVVMDSGVCEPLDRSKLYGASLSRSSTNDANSLSEIFLVSSGACRCRVVASSPIGRPSPVVDLTRERFLFGVLRVLRRCTFTTRSWSLTECACCSYLSASSRSKRVRNASSSRSGDTRPSGFGGVSSDMWRVVVRADGDSLLTVARWNGAGRNSCATRCAAGGGS